MADYRRHLMGNASTTGYQRYDDPDSDVEAEEYENAMGPEPYVPPIVEDPELPGDVTHEVAALGEEAIRDTGDPPMKRPHMIYPGFADYDPGANDFNFNEGGVNVDLEVPDVNWGLFNYNTNPQFRAFFDNYMYIPDPHNVFPALTGPFDGFGCRMSSGEVNINQKDFLFDGVRPIVPSIGYAAGVMGMWLKQHIERANPERRYPHYKAMVAIHCVFVKYLADGTPEYRRFIFDRMCENEIGRHVRSRSPVRLFKLLYNTTIKLCYEKLDMRNCENVPHMDSKFIFYAIRTIAVTIFQYQPLAVH